MKTIGRILIILVVFSALAGLMVTAVNASGANAQSFGGRPGGDGGDGGGFRPGGNDSGFRPQEFDGNRPDRDRERGGGGFSGLMFGAVKNTFVIALLVVVIAWPKSIAKKKRKMNAGKPTAIEQ